MTPEQIAEQKKAETAAAEIKAKAEADASALSQNKKTERTRLEKLRHTKASIEAQIAAEEATSGIIILDEEDDDKPITKGDLKRIEKENAKKTALSLADGIDDENERSQVREILETRIVPSGNPQKDYQTAVDLANSEKHRQLAAETARRKSQTVTRSSNGGVPARQEDEFVPTEQELAAAKMVGKKTAEDIKAFVLKARSREK